MELIFYLHERLSRGDSVKGERVQHIITQRKDKQIHKFTHRKG